MVGPQNPQRIGILVHVGDEAIGQLLDRFAIFDGALDDLVVDVGDVLHIGDVVTRGLQPTVNHVENHHHPGMAEVAVVVHRHAADVHAYVPGFQRGKLLQRTRQRVIDSQAHGI
ncbi:hypothetical protein SDC9_171700 [bioreactor metagenome]|uniref:Uncharacterized protein n=1 Tax=bioreactor metagenome TaxID=1076179 RepID=A0A645GK39_9ZZZZ